MRGRRGKQDETVESLADQARVSGFHSKGDGKLSLCPRILLGPKAKLFLCPITEVRSQVNIGLW